MNIFVEKIYAQWGSLVPVTAAPRVTSIELLMTKVVGWISLIVGILAFFYLIYAGIMYITAGGNPDQAKKGQQGIVNAIIGIIICIFAYTIVVVIVNKITAPLADCNTSPVAGFYCDTNCTPRTSGTAIYSCK